MEANDRIYSKRLVTLLEAVRCVRGWSIDECFRYVPFCGSRSTLRRALSHQSKLSLDLAVQWVDFTAAELDVEHDSAWRFLLTGDPGPGPLADLVFGSVYHAHPRELAALHATVLRRELQVPYVISVHKSLPDFVLPDSVLHRKSRQIAGSAGYAKAVLDVFDAHRRHRYLMRDTQASPQITAVMLASNLADLRQRRGRFADWTSEESETCEENLRDACHRNVLLRVLDDGNPDTPRDLLKPFEEYEEARLCGADFLLKKSADGLRWLTFEAGHDPRVDAHIQNHVDRLWAVLQWFEAGRN